MNDTSSPSTAPAGNGNSGRVNRWLAIALTASLALNLAAAGWAASRYFKHRDYRDGAAMPGRMMEERISRHMPDHAAGAFRKEMERSHREMGGRDGGPGRARLAEALRAEPFDPERLRAEMGARSARMIEYQQSLQAAFLAAASEMTPDERRAYADRMLRRERMHGDRHRTDQGR